MLLQLQLQQNINIDESPGESGILEGLRKKREEDLETLVGIYSAQLSRVAQQYLGDQQLAEDAVQETFIAAWDGAKRTSDVTRLRPWLFAILFNTMKKQIRTLYRRRKREKKAAEDRSESVDHESHGSEEDERLGKLSKAMTGLDENARSVVLLRYMENLSVSETAKVLEIPEGTVKSRTSHAIKKLKHLMELKV